MKDIKGDFSIDLYVTIGEKKMGVNKIENGDFGGSWLGHSCLEYNFEGEFKRMLERGSVFVPVGWDSVAYKRGLPAGADSVPWDANNKIGYAEPEVRYATATDPDRMRSGKQGLLVFTFSRIHDVCLLQHVQVVPGEEMELSAYAHAWSNHEGDHEDNPRWSEGVGLRHCYYDESSYPLSDAQRNFTFSVGVKFHCIETDFNPYSEDVIWGDGAHVYNGYFLLPKLRVVVPPGVNMATVYLRSKTLWPYKHNDAYWDDVSFAVVSEPEPPEPPAERFVVEKGSKIGFHAIHADGVPGAVVDVYADGGLVTAVKAVDDLGWLLMVEPVLVRVARLTSPWEGCPGLQTMPHLDLVYLAQNLMDVITTKIESDPSLRDAVDVWEVVNEPLGGGCTAADYKKLALLMIKCMDIAEDEGLRLGLFSFNAGTPEWGDMVAMAETDVFRQAAVGGHVVCLHEGPMVVNEDAAVDLWWGNLIPGAPFVPDGAGALFGRFKYLKLAIEQADDPMPMFLITECYPGGGYAQDNADPVEIVERLHWYDDLIRADPDMIAALPFTWGPTSQWTHQDYGFVTQKLIEHIVSIKDEPNAVPSEPEEPEPERDGSPRVPYHREYHVLDPSFVTPEQAKRIVCELIDAGEWVTVGPSWDDAMTHYGLDDVNAVGYGVPGAEKQSILQFRDSWYPKANLQFRGVEGHAEPEWTQPVIGIHDEAGGKWLMGQAVPRAACIVPVIVESERAIIDLRHLHMPPTAMFVIARLNWSWARPEGKGTMPPPAQLDTHLHAVVETIRHAQGVDAFILWNEVNNRREHPESFALTSGYVAAAYNVVWNALRYDEVRLAAPPIDPYFGPGSDNRVYLEEMLGWIDGADFLCTHGGKTQTNAVQEIWSNEKFSDDPLRWQFLHSKTLHTFMQSIPARFKDLPVVVAEANPQHKTVIGGELGWTPGNVGWVREFLGFVRDWNSNQKHQKVTHTIFYRFNTADPWGLRNDGAILGAIREEAMMSD